MDPVYEIGAASKARAPHIPIFLCLESLFFVLFVASDLIGRDLLFSGTVWRFFVVVFAFLYVAAELVREGKRDRLFRRRHFLFFAMSMTLVSDVFLLVLADYYTLGVCTFIAAQVFHALEIERSRKQAILSFSLRAACSLLAISVLAICKILTPLYAAVAFYGPQLIGNLLEHLFGVFGNKNREEKRRSLLLACGFALFLACDVCVGLSNIGVSAVNSWIWIFYAPSQALIAISCGRLTHETEIR